MVCRKNFLNLEPDEKERFVDAVRQLRAEDNGYDRYVDLHRDHFFGGMAHGGSGFLPWHREYLRRFENDLQEIDPDVTLPYWDWTEDAARTPDSSLWADDFMGGDGAPVPTGPFSEWGIDRFLGRGTARGLPTGEEVETALALATFPAFTARFEGIHGVPHNWVGGTMATTESPADPVFWLHHANVDRIWAQWQALHPDQVHPALDEPLHPWETTTREVLDHHRLGYVYDTESAAVDPDSAALIFDDVRVGETVSRSIAFSIRSCGTETVTLEIVEGPTVTSGPPGARFDTPEGTTVTVTTTGADETEVRLPISYTGTTPGEQTTGTVTVRRGETGEEWIVTLSATVA